VRGRVAVMAIGECLAAGLDDVRGCGEIRLADAEIDDRAAFGLERLGARQHLEGGLCAEERHPVGKGKHGRSRADERGAGVMTDARSRAKRLAALGSSKL